MTNYKGLLNISFTWPINARGEIDICSRREWSKKHALAKAVGPSCPEQSRREGRSQFDARSVLTVRERERREEKQVCEPEGQGNWGERRWWPLRPGSGHVFSTFPIKYTGVSVRYMTYCPLSSRLCMVSPGSR